MQKVLIACAAALLLVGGYIVFQGNFFQEGEEEASGLKYEKHGVSFSYPAQYVLEERTQGNAERAYQTVTLVNRSDLPAPEGGEGPTAIAVEIFENPEEYDLPAWIRGMSHSNFKLSRDEALTEVEVSGEPALRYSWSGLYEADAVALLHGGRVYLFSGTWMTAKDGIRKDFEALLNSVSFTGL